MAKPFSPAELEALRAEFPVLSQEVRGKPLVYLDNAATSQTPSEVITRLESFYESECSNIHRGVHFLSEQATIAYEAVREKVRAFMNAPHLEEVIFVRGTTEGINLVAQSWGRANLKSGDVVLISEMEHHSHIVPWQMVSATCGATVKSIPITDAGEIDREAYRSLLQAGGVKVVAINHVSNALGTINPVKEMVEEAHAVGAVVSVDGAQAIPHLKVDVQSLGCDFYAFSAHKLYGPTGIGVVWGKREHLESSPPYMGGGDMIKEVTIEATTYNDLPHKFEAGTPHIEGGLGLGAAIDWVNRIDIERIAAQEAVLLDAGTQMLQEVDGLRMIGTAADKAAVCSFVIDGVHPHDLGTLLDQSGVAIRTGHHCAQPVMKRFGVPATARASFAGYNSLEEIETFRVALEKALRLLR